VLSAPTVLHIARIGPCHVGVEVSDPITAAIAEELNRILPESCKERHVVSPHAHVYRIELYQPETTNYATKISVSCFSWPRLGEALSGEGNATGFNFRI
jgi:hypothetical protein